MSVVKIIGNKQFVINLLVFRNQPVKTKRKFIFPIGLNFIEKRLENLNKQM